MKMWRIAKVCILVTALLAPTAPAWAQGASGALISQAMGWVSQGIGTAQSLIGAKQSYELQKRNMDQMQQQQQLQNQQAELQQYRCPPGQTPALVTFTNGSHTVTCITTPQP
jgi:hypothetical protein